MGRIARWLGSLTSKRRGLDPQAVDDFFRTLWIHVEPGPLHASVLTRIAEVAQCERGVLVLLDPGRGDFCVQVSAGDWPASFLEARWPIDDGLVRWLGVNSRPLLTRSEPGVVSSLPAEQRQLLDTATVEIAAPLAAAGRIIGLIAFGRTGHVGGWTRQLAHSVATLAVPAALAFEHAALVTEEQHRLRRLYRAERLATAGTLATGLAHEIRNPLTAIRSGMQLLRDRPDTVADAKEILSEVIAEVDRIDRLVGGLVMFARGPRSDLQSADLVEVVRRAAALVSRRARTAGGAIDLRVPDRPVILQGDAGQLEQVILNLLLNALESSEDPGPVELDLAIEPSVGMGTPTAVLEVRDRGDGLPEDRGERVFDPFFTTKPDGTGLGLSISYNIVARHGGELSLEDRPGGGVVARMILPVREPSSGNPHGPETAGDHR